MKKLAIALSSFVLVLGLATTYAHTMNKPHPEADLSTRRVSKAGLYEVTYVPEQQPIPKRALHAWTVEVHTRDGRPVDGAQIQVSGGMPDHGHGLPTQPVVRQALGQGRYVIDGMKFSMGGYWVVDLAISSAQGKDDVRFELSL